MCELSLRRLFLPPFGCLLRSPSVSLACSLPRARRPRLYRSRWRLNSHGMQSASLYNYASITCSVHALISHFKSMTRTYQASLRSDPGSLPMQVPPTGLFITGFKGSMRPPTLRCLGGTIWLQGGGGGGGENSLSAEARMYEGSWTTTFGLIAFRRSGQFFVFFSQNAADLLKGELHRFNEGGRIGSDTQ